MPVVRGVTSSPGLLGKGGGTRVLAIKGAASGGAAAIAENKTSPCR